MKAIRLLITTVLFFLVGYCYADNGVVDQKIHAMMEKYAVPGVAVQLYVDGKPTSYYYGFANPDKHIPVTEKTIFELGSITKVMTGVLLAQEVDYAKMSFADPVTKYVTTLPKTFDEITLLNLATHASGLPFSPGEDVKTQQALQQYLQSYKPSSAPGDYWVYSNMGIGLLADALENATDWDYNKLYIRHIANPLKMQAIGIAVPAKLMKFYAQGHDQTGQAVATSFGVFPGAGSIKASAGDMKNFLNAAIGLPGVSPRVLWPMRMTQVGYLKFDNKLQGLGWTINPIAKNSSVSSLLRFPADDDIFKPKAVTEVYERPTYDGDALIDKTGGTNGFRSYIAVIPNKKTGIVVLANKKIPTEAIMKTAREILFAANRMG